MIHELKIDPKYFSAVRSGEKRFELRRNDRDFRVGDYLALNEYDRTTKECPAMERVEGGIPYCSDKQAAFDGCHPANGDRIRAKTDEEMADFIVEDCLDGKIHFCKNKPECMKILEQNECIPTEMCRQCALDWLRQPEEE